MFDEVAIEELPKYLLDEDWALKDSEPMYYNLVRMGRHYVDSLPAIK